MTRSETIAFTAAWRTQLAILKTERVLTHNLIVGGGTIAAGLLGVAFQSIVSHQFQPAEYGEVFAVVTLITLIGLPASAFTLLMARETSRHLASGANASSAFLLRRLNRLLLLSGAGLGACVALASPFLASLLNIPVQLLLAATIGLPFGLALPLLIGQLQGEQRFVSLSAVLVGQAGLKLAGAVAFGFMWGPAGIVVGISLASVVAYLIALWLVGLKSAATPVKNWWRPAAAYVAVIVPSTLALAVLLSADVLVVKHFFSTAAAGEYAAVAAIGRAIFWGASGVAAVLFPKVVFRGARGGGGSHLVGVSLALVALGGIAGLALLSLSATWLLTAFSGSAYVGAAVYLPGYAVGMTLLGGVAVLIAAHQTRGTSGFLAILLPLSLLEPVALIAFHQNLTQVVTVVDVCMLLIVVGLGAMYLIQERTRQNANIVAYAQTATAEPRAVQIGAKR